MGRLKKVDQPHTLDADLVHDYADRFAEARQEVRPKTRALSELRKEAAESRLDVEMLELALKLKAKGQHRCSTALANFDFYCQVLGLKDQGDLFEGHDSQAIHRMSRLSTV